MENKAEPPMFVSEYQKAPSLWHRMSDNVLVPIGITLTVGCYAVGLTSLVTNQPKLGQKMMYCRVFFQGMTVAAMFYDQFTEQKFQNYRR